MIALGIGFSTGLGVGEQQSLAHDGKQFCGVLQGRGQI